MSLRDRLRWGRRGTTGHAAAHGTGSGDGDSGDGGPGGRGSGDGGSGGSGSGDGTSGDGGSGGSGSGGSGSGGRGSGDGDSGRAARRRPAAGASGSRGGHADITDFDPHSDGDYRCAEQDLILRFARPIVTETTAPGRHGGDPPEPARGEFTSSGRFTVQRRLGRPVVYTVLEVRSQYPVRAQSLLVRRTDTADRSTAELEFVFEPDSP